MNKTEDTMSRCRKMLSSDAGLDSVLQALRDAGYSKVQSIKALVDLEQASFAEAKIVVHESSVWRDVLERDTDFQENVVDALEDQSKHCD